MALARHRLSSHHCKFHPPTLLQFPSIDFSNTLIGIDLYCFDCRARGDGESTLGVTNEDFKIEEEVTTELRDTPAEFDQKVNAPHQEFAGIPPTWLTGLVNGNHFGGCPFHIGYQNNTCNRFCFGCSHAVGHAMCRHCIPHHHCSSTVPSLQIRRYMLKNVVNYDELSPHYDLSGIQAYYINGKRAVLINPKDTSTSANEKAPPFDHQCSGCKVSLRPDCAYCCLKCKVDIDYGLEPSTPGPARGAHAHAASTGLYLATADFSEERLGGGNRWASELGLTSTLVGCKRRKVVRPLRSPVF
jgi:hypothetical protein